MTRKPKYLNDRDPWMLAEDIPDIDVFFSQIWQSCFVNEFKQPNGKVYKKLLSIQRGLHLWFYFGEQDSNEVGEHITHRVITNPTWAATVNKNIILWADKLKKFAENIPSDNVSQLSNNTLWKIYREHDEVHTKYYQWCWIPVGMDMFHDNLTNKLKQYLRLHVDEAKVNETLVILTQPRKKSLIQKEQEEFLRIASILYRNPKQRRVFRSLYTTFQEKEAAPYGLQTHTPEYERLLEERVDGIKDQISPSILKRIEQHYREYFYIKFMWIGKEGVYSYDHYLKELVKFIGNGGNPTAELKRMQREQSQLQKKRARLIKRLKIEPKWRQVFDQWGDFMVTKIYRRYAQIYAIYRMQPILKEIANRLKLSLTEIRLMLKDEVRLALTHSRLSRASIKARKRTAAYYFEKGFEKVYVGKQAQMLIKNASRSVQHDVEEIRGQVGCVGKARGFVRLIFRPADMQKMKKGDILVSIATDPDIVPAMKKAAAIVTEQGGVTSHAAIVSREMNIPCVIGTKIATKVFKDGDMVEVDATKGTVKKI